MEETTTINDAKISAQVAYGIQAYHKKYNVELLKFKGLNEDYCLVSVRGKMEDLKALNNEAMQYRGSNGPGSTYISSYYTGS